MCYSNAAYDALQQGRVHLDEHYDYQSAITWLLKAEELYEQEPTSEKIQQEQTQTYICLAMSYHHIGKHILRDGYMRKAQEVLRLPADATIYNDKAKFSMTAANWYLVNGYRFYIRYEQSHNASEPIDQQESHLLAAQQQFLKTLEIITALHLTTETMSHAHHGLGTIFEFLGMCQQQRGDHTKALDYAQQSMHAFELALDIRKTILGPRHLHVARSYHKLARSCIKHANLLSPNDCSDMMQELYEHANKYYNEALAIFEANNVDKEQAKYKELQDEYKAFLSASLRTT